MNMKYHHCVSIDCPNISEYEAGSPSRFRHFVHHPYLFSRWPAPFIAASVSPKRMPQHLPSVHLLISSASAISPPATTRMVELRGFATSVISTERFPSLAALLDLSLARFRVVDADRG